MPRREGGLVRGDDPRHRPGTTPFVSGFYLLALIYDSGAVAMAMLRLRLATIRMHHLCVFECVCARSAHHDGQQNVLEVVPEAQRVGAEQGKVSLQELEGDQTDAQSNFFFF